MISFANNPNEVNTVIRLWPDGPPSSLPCVGPEITFGSPADWSSADRPAELHIFTRGGHGFGVGSSGSIMIN